ncbi:MAG: molybdopterin-dependent oxidoreductase [Symploca sp. SIO2E6]|nr:molybdopterin-dependent oxidoreductase [Symploca sp. SIO2E6]
MSGKFFRKPEPKESDLVPPGQRLANGFPVLTYGDAPQITTDNWEFRVWGLAKAKTFNWSDFMAMPQHDFTKDFHCVTRWSKLDVQWTGIVSDLLFVICYLLFVRV